MYTLWNCRKWAISDRWKSMRIKSFPETGRSEPCSVPTRNVCSILVPLLFRILRAGCCEAERMKSRDPCGHRTSSGGVLRFENSASWILFLIPSQGRWGKDIRWNVDRLIAKHFSERRTTSPPRCKSSAWSCANRGWNPPFAGLHLNRWALAEISCRILYFISYNW